MGFIAALQNYLNSVLTQDQLQKYARHHPSSVSLADPKRAKQNLKLAASELAVSLNKAYLEAIGGNGAAAGWDISDVIDGEGGSMTVLLTYTGAFDRDSLYERGYPEGISNIWSLIDTGYQASNYVYGYGTKTYARSRISRPFTGFIGKTISEFESKYDGRYKVQILNNQL